jgi:hypothetical protein
MTIKVNNKSYDFKFTIWTIERTCELLGIDLNDFDDKIKGSPIKGINALYRAALERGSKGKQVLNEFEMDDLVEQMTREDFYAIYKDYLNSIEAVAMKISGFSEPKKK